MKFFNAFNQNKTMALVLGFLAAFFTVIDAYSVDGCVGFLFLRDL